MLGPSPIGHGSGADPFQSGLSVMFHWPGCVLSLLRRSGLFCSRYTGLLFQPDVGASHQLHPAQSRQEVTNTTVNFQNKTLRAPSSSSDLSRSFSSCCCVYNTFIELQSHMILSSWRKLMGLTTPAVWRFCSMLDPTQMVRWTVVELHNVHTTSGVGTQSPSASGLWRSLYSVIHYDWCQVWCHGSVINKQILISDQTANSVYWWHIRTMMTCDLFSFDLTSCLCLYILSSSVSVTPTSSLMKSVCFLDVCWRVKWDLIVWMFFTGQWSHRALSQD